MAKRSPKYSEGEKELIKKRGVELGAGTGKKVPWRKVVRELKKEFGIRRTADAVRAEFYRVVSEGKIGSNTDSIVERIHRSFERIFKTMSNRLQENAELKKENAELLAELKALQRETKPMRLVYRSVLRAQQRAEGRSVVHSDPHD